MKTIACVRVPQFCCTAGKKIFCKFVSKKVKVLIYLHFVSHLFRQLFISYISLYITYLFTQFIVFFSNEQEEIFHFQ